MNGKLRCEHLYRDALSWRKYNEWKTYVQKYISYFFLFLVAVERRKIINGKRMYKKYISRRFGLLFKEEYIMNGKRMYKNTYIETFWKKKKGKIRNGWSTKIYSETF